MIKIGDFARLAQVSIVTLRHYDEIGLLKPSKVDSFTGYRYYSIHQLPRLNRILALKDFGFSLEQIEQVLNGITVDELRGMLKLKHAEVEQKLAEEAARLARIAARLKQIELENAMSETELVLKTVPAMLVASCKVTIPTNDEVPEYLDKAYGAVWGFVHQNQLKPTGSHLALWHQAAEVVTNEVAEAIVPIDRAVPGNGDVQVYELPETQVISYLHQGNFEEFQIAHTHLLKWIEANNYRVTGGYREIYIKFDPENLADSATEVQYPVEKA